MKRIKYHLHRVIGNVRLTHEKMSTFLCQIKECLNSRPLTLSSNPSDLCALAPGYFLTTVPINVLPDQDLTNIKVNRQSRWQHLQQLHQHLWKRWSSECLDKLQQRSKWMTKKRNLKVGNLVILKEDNIPPTRWLINLIPKWSPF